MPDGRLWVVEGIDRQTGKPTSVNVRALTGVQAWDGIEATGIIVRKVHPIEDMIPCYRAVVQRERFQERLRLLGLAVVSPVGLVAVGVVLAALPLAFPVFSREWRELPSATVAGSALSGGWLAQHGVNGRNCADEQGAFLFAGPPAPQTWSASVFVSLAGGSSASLPVTFVPDSVHQQPEYGRVAAESLALLLPFLVSAWVLQRRHGAFVPLADRDDVGPSSAAP
jgi:hypothetical protein